MSWIDLMKDIPPTIKILALCLSSVALSKLLFSVS